MLNTIFRVVILGLYAAFQSIHTYGISPCCYA